MRRRFCMTSAARIAVLVALLSSTGTCPGQNAGELRADPLPSWNEGAAKKAIVEFVTRVTTEGGPDFVPAKERIATFDNDGTLWCEQPIYVQAAYAFNRAKIMAVQDPSLREKPGFQAILSNDQAAMARLGQVEIATVLAVTHSGMTSDEFTKLVKGWLEDARNPRFGRLHKQCVYQPQLELLAYLRSSGFKLYIVTGGGVDFVRAFSEEVYDIPPEEVIGSSTKTRFEIRDGRAEVIKLPEIGDIDDREGKPININLHIGRRPILAFGNSDGDLQMLEYTAGGKGARLSLLVHHDDATREYAYDRDSRVGHLDKALDAAKQQGWTVVSMKHDWRTIFPPVAPRKSAP
jgi:phosphoglycolate phosphatase-like HAD superfamily hydrolase